MHEHLYFAGPTLNFDTKKTKKLVCHDIDHFIQNLIWSIYPDWNEILVY